MADKEIQIPGKLTSIAAERRVADASQIWDGEYQMDQETGADQSTINNRVKRHISEHTEAISEISSALDILNGDEETEGSVQKAVLLEATRAMAVEEDLRQLYDTINANDIIVGARPSSGQEERKIYRVPNDGGATYSDYMWYNDGWVLMATFTISNEPLLVGLYTCNTGAGTAAKTVDAPGFQLPSSGGSIKIKMTNANTANNATLKIGNTDAKPLFYDGARASSANSWKKEETIEVYYDPNNGGAYYANNVAGGGKFGTGEKVKGISISDILTDESSSLPTSRGVKDAVSAANAVGKKPLDLSSFYQGVIKTHYRITEDGTIESVDSNSARVIYTTKLVKRGSILKAKVTSSATTNCRIGISSSAITEENLTQTTLTMLFSRNLTDNNDYYAIVPFDGYIAYYVTTTAISISVYNADVLQDNSVLDVSELNGGSTYESLAAALVAIPSTLRKGGMQIRFIYSDYIVTKITDATEIPEGAVQLNLGLNEGHYTKTVLTTSGATDEQLPATKGLTTQFYTGSGTYTIWNVTLESNGDEYVQYMLRLSTISTNAEFTTTSNWQKIDDIALRLPLLSGVKFSTGGTLDKTAVSDPVYSSILLQVYAGDKFYVRGNAGTAYRVYATYDSDGSRMRLGGSSNNGVIEIEDGERYLVLNLLTKKDKSIIYLSSPVPSRQLYSMMLAIDAYNSAIANMQSNIDAINEVINDTTTTPLTGNQTEHSYLRYVEESNSILVQTGVSPNNSVYQIDISNLAVGQINIGNASYLAYSGGGTKPKLLWAITSQSGTVLNKSEAYTDSRAREVSSITLPVVNGGKWLYVSINNLDPSSLNVTHTSSTAEGLEHLDELYGSINVLQENIAAVDAKIEKVVNIEDRGVQIYNRMKYNNGDYGSTNRDYLTTYNKAADYQLPIPATITFPATESTVTIEVATHPNFDNKRSYQASGTGGSFDVYNLLPEQVYYWRVLEGTTGIATGQFRTEGKTRWLKVAANNEAGYIDNIRDIGGAAAHGNTKIRYECLVRGHALNRDEAPYTNIISNEGIAEMRALGIDAELDLRNGSAGPSPLGQDVLYAYYAVGMLLKTINIYTNVAFYLPKYCNAIRKLIEWLGKGKQVYVHCTGGCDRTGAFFTLVEGLCGVSENDINHEYELSDGRERTGYLEDKIYNGDAKDSGFKYSMMFIKGLRKYNNTIYTKCQSYVNSNIIVGGVQYDRHGTVKDNDVKYCKWLSDNEDVLYTEDIYPTTESTLYDSTFVATELSISKLNDTFYFEVINNTTSDAPITPTPITDTGIINALEGMETPSLRDRFRLLMTLGGSASLSYAEMDRLEELLCS